MSDRSPGERPGHLDIDAVSAFVDRDFVPDDLATIEIHLSQCPACHREVLEIRATVLLLAALPQYAPRRSFCLGHEHAPALRRARRRRWRVSPDPGWTGPYAAAGIAPDARPLAGASPVGAGRYAAWLPGMQAAAVLIGALLLLVTAGDLAGIMPDSQPQARFAAPTVVADDRLAVAQATLLPEAAAPPPEAAVSDADGEAAQEPAFFETAPSDEQAASEGTIGGDSASEELLAGAAVEPTPRLLATMVVASAVTQAAPTPAAAMARDAAPAPAPAPAEGQAADEQQPSRLRMVQLVLALALGWLIVSIVGLKRVRS
jgi:hypothetical protein